MKPFTPLTNLPICSLLTDQRERIAERNNCPLPMSLTTFLQRIATIHAQTPCPKAAHKAIEAEVSACAAALRQRTTTNAKN